MKEELRPIALSLAESIAKQEGIEDEMQATSRANEIVDDIFSEGGPATDIGIELKKKIEENPLIESPFLAPEFNYSQTVDDAVVPAVQELLVLMGNTAAIVPSRNQTDEEKQEFLKALDAVALESFAIFNRHKVPLDYYEYLFELLTTIVRSVKEYSLMQVKGHTEEILSRLIGSKNPGNGKFDSRWATYDQLVKTLESTRKATGDNPNDYFTVGE